MSGGHGGRKKGLGTRALHALVLAGIGALLYFETRHVPEMAGGLGTITAVGFLLLAGTLTGELVEPLGLPHLSGYLIAGIVAGPHVLALVDAKTVERVSPVSSLALALIALAGGAELDLAVIRKGLRSLGWAMVVQTVLVLVVVGGTFVAARPLIGFARSLPFSAVVGVALLWAVLAVSRSPSATLAILSQTRAQGPLMTSTLAFVMTSDVVVVILLAAAMGIARPLVDPTASMSLDSFAALGHEIVGSVAVGTTLGLVLVAYLRLVGRQMLVVLLALGFGASEMLHYLLFDPLLTFMVAGLIVRNLSRQGEKFIRSIEQTSGVVYVVFFATTGAHLDIPLLRALWPVALLLSATRAGITWVAARTASALARDTPLLRTWGWSGLVSQAGLTLGLTVVIEREFPSVGTPFRALAVATVAINEIVGPILFKAALDRAGETSRERAPSFPSMRPPPMPPGDVLPSFAGPPRLPTLAPPPTPTPDPGSPPGRSPRSSPG